MTDLAAEARRLADAEIATLDEINATLRACAEEIERLKGHNDFWTKELISSACDFERQRDAAQRERDEARAETWERCNEIRELQADNARLRRVADAARLWLKDDMWAGDLADAVRDLDHKETET